MSREQIEDIEQSGVYIEQMFHTLASFDSSTYVDFLNEIGDNNKLSTINKNITEEVVGEYNNKNLQLNNLIIDYLMYGFIAEIRMPERNNYKFNKKGGVTSCSVSHGIMCVKYCFAKSIDDLVIEVVKIGTEYYKKKENEARLALNN